MQFNSHLGHFFTWKRSPDVLSGVSPRYSSATNSQLTASSLYRYNMMSNYTFFSKGSSQWGEAFLSIWDCLDICPLLQQFNVTSITQLELSSLTSLKAWGNIEKFYSDISFLLVSTEEGAAGERTYSLSMVWVNPYQARVPTVEEGVKQLTASGLQWT